MLLLSLVESQSDEESGHEEAAISEANQLETNRMEAAGMEPTSTEVHRTEATKSEREESSEEDETPLMRFLKANRELLQTTAPRPQQQQPVATTFIKKEIEDRDVNQPVEDPISEGGMLISNLHLLAEIATRQSPSPPGPKQEPDENVATTSLMRMTARVPPATAGLHLFPLSAVCGRQEDNRDPPVGTFCAARPLAGTPTVLYPLQQQQQQQQHVSASGLLIRAGGHLTLDPRSSSLLLASEGSILLRRSDLFYPNTGATATVGAAGQQHQAAQTATLFSLVGLQPIMSIAESGGSAAAPALGAGRGGEEDDQQQPKYILPDKNGDNPMGLSAGQGASASSSSSSSSCSSRSSSSRESSPKSFSDSPLSLETSGGGGGGGGRVRCAHCGRICSTLAHLNNHIRSVHSADRLNCPKTLQCGQCSKMFGRNSHLVEHVRTVHEGRKRVYQRAQCKDCGKEFARQCSLNQHLSTSHGKQF